VWVLVRFQNQTCVFVRPSPLGRGCREAAGEGINIAPIRIPSSDPSGHLLPEGEGFAPNFSLTWTAQPGQEGQSERLNSHWPITKVGQRRQNRIEHRYNRRMKLLVAALLAVVLLSFSCSSPAPAAPDYLNGRWVGTWGPDADRQTRVVLELKWDAGTLKGTVNPESRPVELAKASFDPKSSAIHMELDFPEPGGGTDHYTIDGKTDPKTMRGTWTRNNGKGDFSLTKG